MVQDIEPSRVSKLLDFQIKNPDVDLDEEGCLWIFPTMTSALVRSQTFLVPTIVLMSQASGDWDLRSLTKLTCVSLKTSRFFSTSPSEKKI
jgi:hypothetical protein